MQRVKAKFVCNSITDFGYNKQAKLTAVYGKEGENADYAAATPTGTIEISIDKDRPASAFFNPRDEFYVYFEKIEKTPT